MQNQLESTPLKSLDEWEDDLLRRYPNPEEIATSKSTEEYRNYEDPKRDSVREFYRLNHTYQTYDFVMQTVRFNNFRNSLLRQDVQNNF